MRTIEKSFKKTVDIDINSFNTFEEVYMETAHRVSGNTDDRRMLESMYKNIRIMLEAGANVFEKDIISIHDDVYRICSLSGNWTSNLMWSHYTNNHEGFCVGYEIRSLKNTTTELTFPVRYRNEVLDLDDSFFDDNNEMTGMSLLDALTLKSKDWEYEDEWRIIVTCNNGDNLQKIYLPCLKEIIIGMKVSDVNKQRLIEIAEKHSIDCYQMVREKGSYEFDRRRIQK